MPGTQTPSITPSTPPTPPIYQVLPPIPVASTSAQASQASGSTEVRLRDGKRAFINPETRVKVKGREIAANLIKPMEDESGHKITPPFILASAPDENFDLNTHPTTMSTGELFKAAIDQGGIDHDGQKRALIINLDNNSGETYPAKLRALAPGEELQLKDGAGIPLVTVSVPLIQHDDTAPGLYGFYCLVTPHDEKGNRLNEAPTKLLMLHYTKWPDHDAIAPKAFASLTNRINALIKKYPDMTVLAHCLAGIGRSATIVAKLIADNAKAADGTPVELNVSDVISHIQKERSGTCLLNSKQVALLKTTTAPAEAPPKPPRKTSPITQAVAQATSPTLTSKDQIYFEITPAANTSTAASTVLTVDRAKEKIAQQNLQAFLKRAQLDNIQHEITENVKAFLEKEYPGQPLMQAFIACLKDQAKAEHLSNECLVDPIKFTTIKDPLLLKGWAPITLDRSTILELEQKAAQANLHAFPGATASASAKNPYTREPLEYAEDPIVKGILKAFYAIRETGIPNTSRAERAYNALHQEEFFLNEVPPAWRAVVTSVMPPNSFYVAEKWKGDFVLEMRLPTAYASATSNKTTTETKITKKPVKLFSIKLPLLTTTHKEEVVVPSSAPSSAPAGASQSFVKFNLKLLDNGHWSTGDNQYTASTIPKLLQKMGYQDAQPITSAQIKQTENKIGKDQLLKNLQVPSKRALWNVSIKMLKQAWTDSQLQQLAQDNPGTFFIRQKVGSTYDIDEDHSCTGVIYFKNVEEMLPQIEEEYNKFGLPYTQTVRDRLKACEGLYKMELMFRNGDIYKRHPDFPSNWVPLVGGGNLESWMVLTNKMYNPDGPPLETTFNNHQGQWGWYIKTDTASRYAALTGLEPAVESGPAQRGQQYPVMTAAIALPKSTARRK